MNPTLAPTTTTRDAGAVRDEIMALVDEYVALAHGPKPFDAATSPVPVNGRVFDSSDVKSLVDSALDFWLTTGRFNKAFEARLAARIGVRYAQTVNSGSSANLVAFAGLTSHLLGERALKPGDEVITAAAGFPTTVNPALQMGAVPVFVDITIPSYNIDVDAVAAAITPKTRAIMVAHTLGNPFDAPALAKLAEQHGLFMVEDCCDALGATIGGRHVGTFGDVGALSFYPAHHITMGEGGAVFTGDPVLRRAMEAFRDWGRDCYCEPGQDNTCQRRFGWQLGDLPAGYDHKFTYSHLGFNLKITDMQAAVGLAQMDHLEDFIAARRRNWAALRAGLADLEDHFILPEPTPGTDPSWFGFLLTVRDGAPFTRDGLVQHLNTRRIGTRLLFGGNLTRQPYMKGRNFRVHGALTNSDKVMRDSFWVGVYPGLSEAHIGYMVDAIRGFVRNA
ncbi:MAG TPA: lipopolysaccharide biosynthesis protein RfbH [Caulobacteraceae bacterium]|nr:lipopolysaccharide biosynthesis protein RfbH [Caulobacteraceae bacterium]